MTHPAAPCALDARIAQYLTLSPCVSLQASTRHALTLRMCCPALQTEKLKPLLFFLFCLHQTSAHLAHSLSESHCAAADITPAQWRPSGTGNALLCNAVLPSRSIPAPQSSTHHSRSTWIMHTHTHTLSLTLWGGNGIFQDPVRMAHLEPNLRRPADHRKVPSWWTFPIGCARDERKNLWVAAIGPRERGEDGREASIVLVHITGEGVEEHGPFLKNTLLSDFHNLLCCDSNPLWIRLTEISN